MRLISFFLVGVFFGIVMTKSEAISWFRIYEMFNFHSFHMYGIIGTALLFCSLFIFIIKKQKFRNILGKKIQFTDKQMSIKRYLFGGIVFGLGWALTGACPGPIFVLIGNGFYAFIIVAMSAIIGTYFYGLFQKKLPH